MPTLGPELRAAREARWLTQARLSLVTGVSVQTIRSMEKGNNPQLDSLLVVVAYLGVPLGEVIRHPRRDTPWVAKKR